MKISIITEGNKETGLGHLTRCISLYQAFEERNIIPKIYLNGDSTAFPFLEDINHEFIDWLNNQDELFKKIKNSDAIIVDSYLAEIEIAYQETATRKRRDEIKMLKRKRVSVAAGYGTIGIIITAASGMITSPWLFGLGLVWAIATSTLELRKAINKRGNVAIKKVGVVAGEVDWLVNKMQEK